MSMIQNRLVPDPSMSDSEYLFQKQANPTKPNIGRVWVQENAVTRLGALAFIRKRKQHHEMAAQRFKSDYESFYGSGTASDPSRVQVDTSPIAHDNGMAARMDRAASLHGAMRQLGKSASDQLIALLVLCIPAGDGLHWRRRTYAVDDVLVTLDTLATIYGYKQRAA